MSTIGIQLSYYDQSCLDRVIIRMKRILVDLNSKLGDAEVVSDEGAEKTLS